MNERDTLGFAAFGNYLLALPRGAKRFIMVSADAVMLPLALWLALVLKFDRLSFDFGSYFDLFLVATASALVIFACLGLYRAVIRFMGLHAMAAVVAGVAVSVVALAAYDRLARSVHVALSVLAIYAALALVYLAGSRFLVRYLVFFGRNGRAAKFVAIYGAGDAGARLSSVLLGGPDFQPVVFIDDKRSLHGSRINGIRVYGRESLPQLIRDHDIERVLLAIPSSSMRRKQEILRVLEPLGIHVQSMPDLSDIISGVAHIDELRDVDVADLLGRDAVPPDPRLFASCIRSKSVMVTGAGGSIGAELCRQIVRLGPRRLVLFEMSELALYTIEGELREYVAREHQTIEIIPLLGNAHHRHRVREVLATYGIQTLYHAAAYKHVPIVEHNVVEGIHNNVISTWYTAEAARETGVETFVLVSTDKAVNPVNVMGATKRLAELVLQALQERTTGTRFCMVRFGNVLASSGSVVPLFKKQIREGGPVTVTHPDVIRYFMTIPEAAQLVIQAGAMAKGGDVFVLNMGRPILIDDLARRMINLMGLTVRDTKNPDGDIEIRYTGLRTAEKLFEELLIGSNITGTDHPMIMRAMEHSVPWDRMQQLLNELLIALASFDCRRSVALLCEAVAEYRQTHSIRDFVWAQKTFATGLQDREPEDGRKVADFIAKRRLFEGNKGPSERGN
ncbi:MAG TPA: nucleoside-diphosphate sugar epimerase/dehydratase [Steroidobacteraceae bacterium]|jgi:FlaA1/EpsC-like NDP-sugar epimerase